MDDFKTVHLLWQEVEDKAGLKHPNAALIEGWLTKRPKDVDPADIPTIPYVIMHKTTAASASFTAFLILLTSDNAKANSLSCRALSLITKMEFTCRSRFTGWQNAKARGAA